MNGTKVMIAVGLVAALCCGEAVAKQKEKTLTVHTGRQIAVSLKNGLKKPIKLTAEEVEDLSYLRAHTQPALTYRLNPGQANQRRMVQRAIARSGLTKERAPHLFTVLDAAFAASDEAPPVPAINSNNLGTPVPYNVIKSVDEVAANRYRALALSSVNGGSQTSTLINELIAVDGSGDITVFAVNQKTTNTEGQNLLVGVEATRPTGAGNEVEGNAFYIYVPQNGDIQKPVIEYSRTSALAVPSQGCLTQPNYCNRDGRGNCISESYKTACTNPSSDPTANPIKLCYYRGSQQECDYYHPTPNHPTDFVIPVGGSVSFRGSSIFVDPDKGTPGGTNTISFNNPAKGGACYIVFTQQAPLDKQYWTVSADKKTLTWNFPAAAFHNDHNQPNDPKNCLNYYDGTNVNLDVSVWGLTMTNGSYANFKFTSDASQVTNPGTYIIPQIQIQQGCMAEGTLIRMADGSDLPIEALADGKDYSVLTADGAVRKVLDVQSGIEPGAMVRIRTESGGDILVTANHPVMTEDGFAQAAALSVGTRLRTAEGVEAVTRVDRERFSGKVYNLRIGDAEDAVAGRSTVIANGIVNGDSETQHYYDRLSKLVRAETPAEVLARLPKEWHQDYLNSLVERQ